MEKSNERHAYIIPPVQHDPYAVFELLSVLKAPLTQFVNVINAPQRVASVLVRVLDERAAFNYVAVQSCVDPPAPRVPVPPNDGMRPVSAPDRSAVSAGGRPGGKGCGVGADPGSPGCGDAGSG